MPNLKATGIVSLRLVADYPPWVAGDVVQVDELRALKMFEAEAAVPATAEGEDPAPSPRRRRKR